MKKLFISCPMKGRTDENIRKSIEKMHVLAEIIYNQELEVIPTLIEEDPPENVHEPIWYLGQSILMLSEADYFIGIDSRFWQKYKGCGIEARVAMGYNTPICLIDPKTIMPDIFKKKKEVKHE